MAKHIPQLAHLRAAAVHDVRKPFFLQPLFTFLSSPTSSAVRDYRSVLFERLQNIHVRSAQGFLRSVEWHVDCVWPFLGAAICDWEFPVVCTPAEFIGWFDLKNPGFERLRLLFSSTRLGFVRGSHAFLRSRQRLVSSLLLRPGTLQPLLLWWWSFFP